MEISSKRVFSFFLGYFRARLGTSSAIALLVVLANGANVLAPWYFKQLVDLVAQPGAADLGRQASILLASVMGLKLLIILLQRGSSLLLVHLETDIMTRIPQDVFAYLQRHSYQFFTDSHSGSLTRKTNRLRDTFENLADTLAFNIIPFVINIGFIVVAVWLRSPTIAAFIGLSSLVFTAILYIWSQKILPYSTERAAKDSEASGAMTDSFANNTTVKLFAGYPSEEKRIGGILSELKNLQYRSWSWQEWGATAQNLMFFVLEAGTMGGALYYWTRGRLTIGDFVLLQSYLAIVISQFWMLNRVFKSLFRSLADAKEGLELMDLPHGVQDKRRAKALEVKRGVIEFAEAGFNYNQTRKVFEAFDLKIKSGERLALVGPSGSGKSTLVKLLLRFYDLDGGKILIDGQDIAKATQDSLRKNIALVPQDPQLFHRSVMENLRYGRPEATDEEVYAAAKLAHCHEFIEALPDGYDSLVGERGIKLSGGERQRVAIARALLTKAPILVLDEATSSLDSESEALIQESLKRLMQGRTTIAIAHRLSTIMQMDRIVVLEDGAIVDTGKHEELLKRQGLYRKLWNIQAGGYEGAPVRQEA